MEGPLKRGKGVSERWISPNSLFLRERVKRRALEREKGCVSPKSLYSREGFKPGGGGYRRSHFPPEKKYSTGVRGHGKSEVSGWGRVSPRSLQRRSIKTVEPMEWWKSVAGGECRRRA